MILPTLNGGICDVGNFGVAVCIHLAQNHLEKHSYQHNYAARFYFVYVS